MVAWPMKVESAFAFTPAAIISEALRTVRGPQLRAPDNRARFLLLEFEDAVGQTAPLVGGVGQVPQEGVDRVFLFPLERTVDPSAIWLVSHIAVGRQRGSDRAEHHAERHESDDDPSSTSMSPFFCSKLCFDGSGNTGPAG